MGSLVVGLRRQADLAESGPSAAVSEDDVRITESFSEVVPHAMAELPEDWDLLFLGCFTCSKTTFGDWLMTCGGSRHGGSPST